MRVLASLSAVVVTVALTACNHAPVQHAATDPSPATVLNGRLVGPNQMTLYTFDRDIMDSGKSMCYGSCATNWPPLIAPNHAQPIGSWSVVTRNDGARQWAYKGKPVYYWIKDGKPGDATGDGVGNAWRIAKP